MTCDEFKQIEYEYITGTLSEDKAAEAAEHAAHCGECGGDVSLCRMLKELPVPQAADNFTARVMQSVRAVPQKRNDTGIAFVVACFVVCALSSVAGFINLLILNKESVARFFEKDGTALVIINELARLDSFISRFAVLAAVYIDDIVFAVLAAVAVGTCIYSVLNFGGSKK